MERLKNLIEEKNISEFKNELRAINRIDYGKMYDLSKFCIENEAEEAYTFLLEYGLRKDFFPDNNLEIFLRSSFVNEKEKENGRKIKFPIQLEFETQVKFFLIFTKVIPENRLFSLLLKFIERSVDREKITENYLKCSSDLGNTIRYFIENERIKGRNIFRREEITIERAFELKQNFVSMEKNFFIKTVLIPLLFCEDVEAKERISNFFFAISLYLPGMISSWREKGDVSKNIESFKFDINLAIIKTISEMADRKLEEVREILMRSSLIL